MIIAAWSKNCGGGRDCHDIVPMPSDYETGFCYPAAGGSRPSAAFYASQTLGLLGLVVSDFARLLSAKDANGNGACRLPSATLEAGPYDRAAEEGFIVRKNRALATA
jgi:hypothetical protein